MKKLTKKQKYLLPFMVALFANIFVGLNGVWIKVGSESMNAVLFSGVRYTAVGLILVLLIKGSRIAEIFRSWQLSKAMLLNAGLMLGFIVFYSIGIDHSTALKASILALIVPVMVYILSLSVLREPLMKQPLIGGIISLLGSLLVVGLPALLNEAINIGDVYLLLSYVLFALSIVHAKYLYRWFTAMEVVTFRFGLAGLAIVAYKLTNGGMQSIATAEPGAWIAMAFAVTLSGFLSLPLLYWSLGKIGAERSAPLLYADPLAGALLASILLGERMDTPALIGVSVVVFGLIMSYPHHMRVFHRFHISRHHRHPLFEKLKGLFKRKKLL